MVEPKHVVSIPYPSREWSKAMAAANRALEFTPVRFQHMSKEELEKQVAKLRKEVSLDRGKK